VIGEAQFLVEAEHGRIIASGIFMDTRAPSPPPRRSTSPGLALACCVLLGCAKPRVEPTDAPPVAADGLLARLRASSTRAPLVIAHRGDSAAFPENTLPSFAAALAAGADIVELDFVATRDGTLVCLHDKTFDRTTDAVELLGRKGVSPTELTLEEVRRLDAGSWKAPRFAGTRVPTLEEALRALEGGAVTLIERKEGEPEALVELLRRLDLVGEVLVQSFDWDWLARLHRLEPRLVLAALGDKELTPERLAAIAGTGARIVHWKASDLRWEDIAALDAAGSLVAAFTINDDVSFAGAAALGLDAITTDRPRALRRRIEGGQVQAAHAR
jgi:glycerophosphoryl diester phosphodiesterase